MAEEGPWAWDIVKYQYEARVLYATLNLCLTTPSFIAASLFAVKQARLTDS